MELKKLILEAISKPLDMPKQHSDFGEWGEKMKRIHDLDEYEHDHVMRKAKENGLTPELAESDPEQAQKLYFKAHLKSDEEGKIW